MRLHFLSIALLVCLITGSLVSGTGCNLITGAELDKTATAALTSTPIKTTSVLTSPSTSTLRVEDITVIVEPCQQDPEGDISFDSIKISKEKFYQSYYDGVRHIEKYDQGFVISGIIRNKSGKRYWVAHFAIGFDKSGKLVSQTLNAGPIIGVAQLCFEETTREEFQLRMTWSENVSVFKIYSQKSAIMFP